MVGIVDRNILMLHNSDISFNMGSVRDINSFYLSPGSPGPKKHKINFHNRLFILRRGSRQREKCCVTVTEEVWKQIGVHNRKKIKIFTTFQITRTAEFRKALKHEAHSFLWMEQMQFTAIIKYFLERKASKGYSCYSPDSSSVLPPLLSANLERWPRQHIYGWNL